MLQRAVRWVMCAHSPLDSCRLLSAIRVEIAQAGRKSLLAESDITEDTLKKVCRNLIVWEPRLKVWKFPHASVAEYFAAKDESWIKNAEAEITVVLINCLTNCCAAAPTDWLPQNIDGTQENAAIMEWLWTGKADPENTLDPRHPLQIYIQLRWVDHIRHLWDQDIKSMDVVQALKRFMGESPQQASDAYHVYVKYIMASQFGDTRMRDFIFNKSPVFGIVAMGLHQPLDGWWERDLDSALLPNLLQIAIYFGHTDLCENFIGRKCDLDDETHTGRPYGSPLGRVN